MSRLALVALLLGGSTCQLGAEGPLGIPLTHDGLLHAGVATVDVTPTVVETMVGGSDDLFDGCIDSPTPSFGCTDGFEDVNGNGWFDGTWVAGGWPRRVAPAVADPLSVRALVLSHGQTYAALVTVDTFALTPVLVERVQQRLQVDGFAPDRLVVAATGTLYAPDLVGTFGDSLGTPAIATRDQDYADRVADAVETAVRGAAGSMKVVSLRDGAASMRDTSIFLTGANFGGLNTNADQVGGLRDQRDPQIVADDLTVLQGLDDGGRVVFSLTTFPGRIDAAGLRTAAVSAGWPGLLRGLLEAHYGGVALHLQAFGTESLSMGEARLPLIREDGTREYYLCLPGDVVNINDEECYGLLPNTPRPSPHGAPWPRWAQEGSDEQRVSAGWLLADTAILALERGEASEVSGLAHRHRSFEIAVENERIKMLLEAGALPWKSGQLPSCTQDATQLCVPARVHDLTIGPLRIITAPGFVSPELALGVPTADPRWALESESLAGRGPQSVFFPHQGETCGTLVDPALCDGVSAVDSCDCLGVFPAPYEDSAFASPLLELVEGEASSAVVVGRVAGFGALLVSGAARERELALPWFKAELPEEAHALSFGAGEAWQAAARALISTPP